MENGCSETKVSQTNAENIKTSKKSPFGQMLDAVSRECLKMGIWSEDMHRNLPKKWEKHGDMILLPEQSFTRPEWRMLGRTLWKVVAESLQCERLGKKRRIESDDYRTPHIELLYGPDGWVEHVDNGVKYLYDVTKCMFSIGNITEKLRIATFDCRGETIVDMFAGIGYFTLPYLIHAKAALLYACDWNADAIEALQRSLLVNKVAERCIVLEGDCRKICPTGVADRVNLGLLPTASPYWLTACRALKPAEGGYLHIHENVTSAKLQKSASCDKPEIIAEKHGLLSSAEAIRPLTKILEKTLSLDETQQQQQIQPDDKDLPQLAKTSLNLSSEENSHSESPVPPPTTGRRRLSQTIGEELANLDSLIYEPPVADNFAENWPRVDKAWRDFAVTAARKCHRYMNNLHHKRYVVKICRIGKIKSYAPRIDHVVLDLYCHPENP